MKAKGAVFRFARGLCYCTVGMVQWRFCLVGGFRWGDEGWEERRRETLCLAAKGQKLTCTQRRQQSSHPPMGSGCCPSTRPCNVDVSVRVVGGGGEETTAQAFVSRAGLTLAAGPLPLRAAYAARLRSGAAALGLDDDAEWAAWLAGLPTIGDGGALPGEYGDTAAGRVAGVAAGASLVAAGVAAAVAGAR